MINLSGTWDLIKELLSNPVIGPLSFVIGILSFIGTILALFYNRSKNREKRPVYALTGFNLVKDAARAFDHIQLVHTGQAWGEDRVINDLTIVKLAFWNAGKSSIGVEDISSEDPLRIEVAEGLRILDCKIAARTDGAAGVALEPSDDGTSVRVNFQFLNYQQGILVQVAHNGLSANEIALKGTIKDARQIGRRRTSIIDYLPGPAKLGKLIPVLAFVLFTVILVGSLYDAALVQVGVPRAQKRPIIDQVLDATFFALTVPLFLAGWAWLRRLDIPGPINLFGEKKADL